ncbi:hypothetical protein V8E36_007586 [Tilletia maclaganii]
MAVPRLILEGGPYFTSTTPLEKLERMGIADFQAPRRFSGRYLLCRVISAPLLYVGCTFIIDDPSGLATPLSIAHFQSSLNLPPLSPTLAALLPRGTILAIREPFVSLNHHISTGGPIQGKAAAGVRVSSPTDVVVLEAGDERLRGVEWKVPLAEVLGSESKSKEEEGVQSGVRPHEWMREGPCVLLAKGKVTEAERPTARSALANLERLLAESRPGAAYRELIAARRLGVLPRLGQDIHGNGISSPTEEQVSLQHVVDVEARILHALRAYNGLRDLHHSTKLLNLAMPDAQRHVLEQIPRYRPQSTDEYSMDSGSIPSQDLVQALYTLDRTPSALNPIPELYGQDYISSALSVTPIPNAGRGLVTNRDVAPRELLLCCNAVEPCFAEDERWAELQVLRLGLAEDDGGEGSGGGGGGVVAEGVSVTTTQVMACTRLVHALVDRRRPT